MTGPPFPSSASVRFDVQPDREVTPPISTRRREIVGLALEAGYRHIDTAQSYGTEQGVGRGDRRLRHPPGGAVHHQQARQRQPPTGRRAAFLRPDPREPRPRLARPVPDPLAAAHPVRRRLRLDLEGHDRAGRRGTAAYRRESRTSSPPTWTASSPRPGLCRPSTSSSCTRTSPTTPLARRQRGTASR